MTEPAEPLEPAEPPTEGDDPDSDDQPEQTLEQAAADYGSAELWAQIDKANDTYITRVLKIVGPDAPLAGCDHCQGRGFTLGQVEPAPAMLDAEDAVVCQKCNGYGQTKTGALPGFTGQPLKPCGRCGGRGWHEKPIELAPVVPIAAQQVGQPVPVTPQPVGGQWVPGRGFIPYGGTEPIVPDPAGVTS